MSYNVRVIGYLKITPPLKWAEIKDSRFYPSAADGRHSGNLPDVLLQVDTEEVETDEGVTTLITSQYIVPCTSSRYSVSTIEGDVEELLGTLEGHAVSGELTLWGEEYGDIRRILVDAEGVREEKAKLSWPDGTEVALP